MRFRARFRDLKAPQHWRRAGVAVLFVASSILAIRPLLAHPGWPANHELLAWAVRLRVIAMAMHEGDLVPLWWAEDVFGMGSPMPLLYHKLFHAVAAPLFLLTGSVKTSALLAIVFFSVLGVWGSLRMCRSVGAPFPVALGLALAFPHLHYAATDWLVRGAFAEYALLSLTPWLIAWCVELVRLGRFGYWIAPLLFAYVMAHSVVAPFSVIPLAAAVVLTLLVHRERSVQCRLARRAAIAGAGFALAILPWAVLMLKAQRVCSLGLAVSGSAKVANQFQPLHRYVWDPDFAWSVHQDEPSLLLDLPVLAGLVVTFGLISWHKLARAAPNGAGRAPSSTQPSRRVPLLAFFVVVIGFLLWMQTPGSLEVYHRIPRFLWIQYPWRLLTLISVLFVGLLALSLACAASHYPRAAVGIALVVLGATMASGPAPHEVTHAGFTEADIERIEDGEGFAWAEYWPTLSYGSEVLRPARLEAYREFARQAPVATVSGGPCRALPLTSPGYLSHRVRVDCASPAELAFPLTYSGMEMALSETAGIEHRIVTYRTEADPRIRLRIGAGDSRVTIEMPTLWRLLRWHGFGTIGPR
jgi:hypothetical protein